MYVTLALTNGPALGPRIAINSMPPNVGRAAAKKIPCARQLGIADRLAPLISEPRNPLYVTHSVSDILRARMLAIACGYEDGDDLDMLRTDPGFKVACGRLPESGDDLCSPPTVSRWENAPSRREVVRMTYAMIDLYCHSHDRPPASVILDIDDTCDGHRQLVVDGIAEGAMD